jgi:hypothetical protein
VLNCYFLDQAGRGSAVDDFSAAMGIEFLRSVLQVKLDSAFTDEHGTRNLLIA